MHAPHEPLGYSHTRLHNVGTVWEVSDLSIACRRLTLGYASWDPLYVRLNNGQLITVRRKPQ